MDDRTRPRARPDAPTAEPPGDAAHLADTMDVFGRARDDEDAAAAARVRYRHERMTPVPQDAAVTPLLCPTERLLAVRRDIVLYRRQPTAGSDQPGVVGDLYVTSARLLFRGRLTLSFGLDEIEESMLAGDRLLLLMRDGAGVSFEADQPRLLQVELATARAEART